MRLALLFLASCAVTGNAGLRRRDACQTFACIESHPAGWSDRIHFAGCISEALERCKRDGITENDCLPTIGEDYAGQCAWPKPL